MDMGDRVGRWGDLKLRWIWKKGYKSLMTPKESLLDVAYKNFLKLFIGLSNAGRTFKNLLKEDKTTVVSIQPEINTFAESLKKRTKNKLYFFTVIIDLAFHGLWKNRGIDLYFAPNKEVHQEILRFGIPPERVIVSGLPLRKEFKEVKKYSAKKIKEKLKIPPKSFVVLVIGGLLGKMIDYFKIINSLSEIRQSIEIIVITGKNKEIYEKLKRERMKNLRVLGVVENMAEIMYAADLIVSKPGSVTIAESLALGKPMVVITPLAGSYQEIRFANYLTRNQAGVWIKNAEEASKKIEEILKYKDYYKKLKYNAERIGSIHLSANQRISTKILNYIKKEEK